MSNKQMMTFVALLENDSVDFDEASLQRNKGVS